MLGQQAVDDSRTGMLLIVKPGEVTAGVQGNTKGSKKSWRYENLTRCFGVSRVRSRYSRDGVFPGKALSQDLRIGKGCGPDRGSAGNRVGEWPPITVFVEPLIAPGKGSEIKFSHACFIKSGIERLE